MRIVMTSGAFDLLHIDHVRHLKECRQHGDWLMVALNSDESVRRRKGEGRPIVGERERQAMLIESGLADAVLLFDEDTPEGLIHVTRPDVFVVGSDYADKSVAGREFIESYGGKVVIRSAGRTTSTTQRIERIESRYAIAIE